MYELNSIVVGDCLELMKNMPDDSVDFTFTSPPYNDDGKEMNGPHMHCKYEKQEDYDDYLEWLCERVDEMLRVTKTLVLFNIQGISNCRKELYKFIGRYSDRIHDIVIWNKLSAQPTGTPHKLSNYYEMLILLKPDGISGVSVNSSFYKNVITIDNKNTNKYSDIHKAVMNSDFCMEVIREFTKEGSTVLDPFMGLGTTALCCKKLNRNYIGFEIYEKYAQAARNRILEETAKDGLW